MAITGNNSPVHWRIGRRRFSQWTIDFVNEGSGAETSITVPKSGELTHEWELSTPGSSSTMQPTYRRATGAWDGSGAGANNDINRASAAAAQGKAASPFPFDVPAQVMYVRPTFDNATEDATGQIIITVGEGRA